MTKTTQERLKQKLQEAIAKPIGTVEDFKTGGNFHDVGPLGDSNDFASSEAIQYNNHRLEELAKAAREFHEYKLASKECSEQKYWEAVTACGRKISEPFTEEQSSSCYKEEVLKGYYQTSDKLDTCLIVEALDMYYAGQANS